MMTRVLVESVVISLLCAFELRLSCVYVTFELRIDCVWTWLEPFSACKLRIMEQ